MNGTTAESNEPAQRGRPEELADPGLAVVGQDTADEVLVPAVEPDEEIEPGLDLPAVGCPETGKRDLDASLEAGAIGRGGHSGGGGEPGLPELPARGVAEREVALEGGAGRPSPGRRRSREAEGIEIDPGICPPAFEAPGCPFTGYANGESAAFARRVVPPVGHAIGHAKPLEAARARSEAAGADVRARPFLVINDEHAPVLELDQGRVGADEIVDDDVLAPGPAIVMGIMEGRAGKAVGQDEDAAGGPQEIGAMAGEAKRLRNAPGLSAIG
jgi:hypothetical protein